MKVSRVLSSRRLIDLETAESGTGLIGDRHLGAIAPQRGARRTVELEQVPVEEVPAVGVGPVL